jgi:hypothetical protein
VQQGMSNNLDCLPNRCVGKHMQRAARHSQTSVGLFDFYDNIPVFARTKVD